MRLRTANSSDSFVIWTILQQAIAQRKADGSEQWQDGYPNPETIAEDLAQGFGYVIEDEGQIIGYAAIIFGIEPAYEEIEGKWLTNGDYVVVHRVALSDEVKGKGMATRLFSMIEDLAKEKGVFSIKVDTNFDNSPMLRILDKLEYSYCGEVFYRGAPRKAYEKVLN